MNTVEVIANLSSDRDHTELFSVKLTCESFELNVHVPAPETGRFAELRQESSERPLRLGTSAGASVFWNRDERGVTVMVGHDDETWDFAVKVQPEIGELILAAIEDERRHWQSATTR